VTSAHCGKSSGRIRVRSAIIRKPQIHAEEEKEIKISQSNIQIRDIYVNAAFEPRTEQLPSTTISSPRFFPEKNVLDSLLATK